MSCGRRQVAGTHTSLLLQFHNTFNSPQFLLFSIPSIPSIPNSLNSSSIHGGPLRLYRTRSSGRTHAETDVIVRARHSDWLRPFTWSAILGWVFRPDAGIARPPGCKTYVTCRACLALGRWMVVQLKAFVQPNVRVGILPQKTRLRVDCGKRDEGSK